MKVKNFRELIPHDFIDSSIWVPSEDLENEDEVTPWEGQGTLETEGIYYVATEFKLADGTLSSGFVRISEATITLIAIAVGKTSFAMLLLVDVFRELIGQTYESFSHQLGKEPAEVFPIRYRTPFSLADKSPVKGELAYRQYNR